MSDSTPSRAVQQQMAKTDDPDTVYVVASNYDGDPHPHIEGVFDNEEDAEELRKRCAAVTEPPHPIAWGVHEVVVR